MKPSFIQDRLNMAGAAIAPLGAARIYGRISDASEFGVDVTGFSGWLTLGDRIEVEPRSGLPVAAEIVSFRQGVARALTFTVAEGLGPGSLVSTARDGCRGSLGVTDSWIGRVVDPMGRPLDGRGVLPDASQATLLRRAPPAATLRARLGQPIDLGVTALNAFTTCRTGQRMGLFAGSGVGKSTLLAMLARHAQCDVIVLALIGERGREVREFLEEDLGPDGLARAVVVVATSDSSPLIRREAAYAAMAIAEKFRDDGKHVLLLMDSVTRFCHALREIALAAGEPPATRGYPPSVFAELPRLLERAGPGLAAGDRTGYLTGLFTVLVEGDDHNEPVADSVRGILDGHVILDRKIGERGRYPAIDVLRSLSRTAPGCNTAQQAALVRRARAILALHADVADLVRLGAYRTGVDAAVDEAIRLAPRIEAALAQDRTAYQGLAESFAALALAMEEPVVEPPRPATVPR